MISEKPWRAEAVLLLGVGLLIILLMGIVSAAIMKGRDASPDFIGFAVGTVLAQVFALVLIHFFIKVHQMSWRDLLGLRQRRLLAAIVLGIVVGVVGMVVTNVISSLIVKVITELHRAPAPQITVQVLQQTTSPVQRAVFALAALIFAPVVEETLFRGILYPLLKHNGYPRLAFWGTSLLFAAIHFDLPTFIPLFLFGLILIWVYERTDTLLAPILTHATLNTINFLMAINLPLIEQWLKRFQ